MESEEDQWAGMGMCDDEETLPQKTACCGEDAGDEGGHKHGLEDQKGRQLPVDGRPPEENHVQRARWWLSSDCGEPQLA